MINPFDDKAVYESFGRNKQRDHALCPHCGKMGNKIDEGDILWNEHPKATDHDYQCASCNGEWIIRRYHQTGYEKYPSAPYACIYIPTDRTKRLFAAGMHDEQTIDQSQQKGGG